MCCALYGTWGLLVVCKILLRGVGRICPPGKYHSGKTKRILFLLLSEPCQVKPDGAPSGRQRAFIRNSCRVAFGLSVRFPEKFGISVSDTYIIHIYIYTHIHTIGTIYPYLGPGLGRAARSRPRAQGPARARPQERIYGSYCMYMCVYVNMYNICTRNRDTELLRKPNRPTESNPVNLGGPETHGMKVICF